ncbi:hypothetical protein M876_12355 [Elizabethkingia anophelis FMS-007]|nr:hypothetical protein M876_12355 [Elizabethkingia anophelis FMS-007]
MQKTVKYKNCCLIKNEKNYIEFLADKSSDQYSVIYSLQSYCYAS